MYELLLADNSVVTWQGSAGENAAERYADAHRDATVIAWRHARGAMISVLTRGVVIDGARVA